MENTADNEWGILDDFGGDIFTDGDDSFSDYDSDSDLQENAMALDEEENAMPLEEIGNAIPEGSYKVSKRR